MSEFRIPEKDVVKEIRHRLKMHKYYSFDQEIVGQLLARLEKMEEALIQIASCKKLADGDVVDIARKTLEAKP